MRKEKSLEAMLSGDILCEYYKKNVFYIHWNIIFFTSCLNECLCLRKNINNKSINLVVKYLNQYVIWLRRAEKC